MEDVPFKDYEEIRGIADDFLEKYHPSCEIPVPIEEIVEFRLELDIIPIPGLQDVMETDGLTTDGFIYGDQSAIAVDEFVYKKRPSRYRFTLAHEIGHLILHPQCFKERVTSIDKWKEYINNISDPQYSMMEWQANCFAGLVLVPIDCLKEKIPQVIEAMRQTKEIVYSKTLDDFIWDLIRMNLASSFEVSRDVINIRMEKDKLYRVFKLENMFGE
jgi:hypothetical protein